MSKKRPKTAKGWSSQNQRLPFETNDDYKETPKLIPASYT